MEQRDMTEREYTDEEVIKALECCINDNCDNCPDTFGNCEHNAMRNALDLINRQKAEIDILVRKHDTLLDEIADKQAEIENLQKINAKLFRDFQCAEELISDTHDKMLHLIPRLKFIKQYIHKGEKAK